MNPLTPAQAKLLAYLKSRKTCPTFEEMMKSQGLRSKSGVHRLIIGLEERGYLKRIPNRARCIELLAEPRLPDENTLSVIPTRALADEARRRGLVIGEYHRERIRVGELRRQRRRFVELVK